MVLRSAVTRAHCRGLCLDFSTTSQSSLGMRQPQINSRSCVPSWSAAARRLVFFDTMIAGHALALGAILVTNNQRHFGKVRSLEVENWSTDAGEG